MSFSCAVRDSAKSRLQSTCLMLSFYPEVVPDSDELLARVRSAAELLEGMAEDRAPLEQLPGEDRERLQRAVAEFYLPDPVARRRRLKAAERERAAARTGRVGAVLEETGIRTLRRKPVFTTPNVFPPPESEQR